MVVGTVEWREHSGSGAKATLEGLKGFWQAKAVRKFWERAGRRQRAGLYPQYRVCSTTLAGPLGFLSIICPPGTGLPREAMALTATVLGTMNAWLYL